MIRTLLNPVALVVLVGSLLLCNFLAAEERPKIEGANGKSPHALLVLDKDNGNPLPLWVAVENVVPRIKPDETSSQTDAKIPGYLDVIFYSEDWQGEYYLLARKGPDGKAEHIGWVPARHLIRQDALRETVTQIYHKGLIVNSQKAAETTDLTKVLFHKAPGEKGTATDNVGALYNIFFIFAKADGYVLLGTSPRLGFLGESEEDRKKPTHVRNIILGWLPISRVCEWKTREGFQWDHESTLESASPRRTYPGRIYETPGLAKQAADARTLEEYLAVPYLFDETFDDAGKSPEMPHDAPRFPILKEMTTETHPRGRRLFEVGGVGGLGKILDKTQIDAIKSELTRWEEIESGIEILFIIDDTKSMQDWFSIVGTQLENILKTAQTDRTKKVRIAVSYYNDITGTNEVPFAAHPLVDIVDSGRGIIKQLRDHKETDGGDALEMVHRGIVEALDKAKFSQHARKMVIVVGDCGDIRHSPKRMEEDRDYSKKYNAQGIVERLLNKGDSPVEFYAIHALQQDRMPNEDTKAYETDMNEIIKEYETRLVSLKMEGNAECFPSSMVVKAPEAIENQFKRLRDQAEQRLKTIKLLMAGKFKEAKPSKDLLERFNKLVQKQSGKKLTLDDLAKAGVAQVFEVGYVWERSPQTKEMQINKRLFLSDGELMRSIDLLTKLEENDQDKTPSVSSIAAQFIQEQAGNLIPPELRSERAAQKRGALSINDCVKMQSGLVFKTGFLSKKLDELVARNNSTDRTFDLNEKYQILNKRDILQDIRENKKQVYETYEDDLAGLKVTRFRKKGERIDEQRLHHLPFDQSRYWVWLDYAKEWP